MDGDKRLCTCGHNIWDHEDAEGGTHECTHRGCTCLQFKDADDDASSAASHESKEKP